MEITSRKQHEQLIRKEEELRLSILDLNKELEDNKVLKENEKLKLGKEIVKYSHVLSELPYPVISINNLGFVLFFNKQSEKIWGIKSRDIIGNKAELLFDLEKSSDVIQSFVDPARTKTSGTYPAKELVLPEGKSYKRDLRIISTDLKDEFLFTLLML